MTAQSLTSGDLSDRSGFAAARFAAAEILLKIGAVHINARQPYRLTSGWFSPLYVDVRQLLSFPAERSEIIGMAVNVINGEQLSNQPFGMLAGGESAGIPFAALLADRLRLPMVYVRKSPKSGGLGKRIEGVVRKGVRLLLVEDHMSDGRSKVDFIQALRTAGMQADDCLALCCADIFPQSKLLSDHGIVLRFLATYDDLLVVAERDSQFDQYQLQVAREFLRAPVEWSNSHAASAQAVSKSGISRA